jgi:hypothetical protein
VSRAKNLRRLRRHVKDMGLDLISVRLNGRGHWAMEISNGEITRTITHSATPSDWRSERNFISRMRRVFVRQTEELKGQGQWQTSCENSRRWSLRPRKSYTTG